MPTTYIPHNKPTLGSEEFLAAQEVLSSGLLTGGNQVTCFENEICHLLGLPLGHAVATSTGSSALFLALTALESKHVVIPSYVCHSLTQAAELANTQISIVDTEPGSTRICSSGLKRSEADTLIYPYLFGQASSLPSFSGHIIEDVAQALGASFNGKALGTIADIGVLSFYATKLITSGGQGGMVVSKNKEHIDKIRHYLSFDMPTDKQAHFNFPLTEIQAAIGRVQLSKLASFIEKREQLWQIYQQAGLPLLVEEISSDTPYHSIPYRAVIMTKKAPQLIAFLEKNKIKAIIPIEAWELLSPTKNATELAKNTVSLPLYPSLTLSQAEKIAQLCKQFI